MTNPFDSTTAQWAFDQAQPGGRGHRHARHQRAPLPAAQVAHAHARRARGAPRAHARPHDPRAAPPVRDLRRARGHRARARALRGRGARRAADGAHPQRRPAARRSSGSALREVVEAALASLRRRARHAPGDASTSRRTCRRCAWTRSSSSACSRASLGNVAKHTPAGTPLAIAARAAGDELEVSVEDDGPGAARRAARRRCSSRSQRGESAAARARARAWGSRSAARSSRRTAAPSAPSARAERGARFVFTLPLSAPSARRGAGLEARAPRIASMSQVSAPESLVASRIEKARARDHELGRVEGAAACRRCRCSVPSYHSCGCRRRGRCRCRCSVRPVMPVSTIAASRRCGRRSRSTARRCRACRCSAARVQLLRRSRLAPFQTPESEGAMRTSLRDEALQGFAPFEHQLAAFRGKLRHGRSIADLPLKKLAPRSTTVTVRAPNSTPSANARTVCAPGAQVGPVQQQAEPVAALAAAHARGVGAVGAAGGLRAAWLAVEFDLDARGAAMPARHEADAADGGRRAGVLEVAEREACGRERGKETAAAQAAARSMRWIRRGEGSAGRAGVVRTAYAIASGRCRRRRTARRASASTGRDSRYPWPNSQPSSCSARAASPVSMPSANTCFDSAWPSLKMAFTISLPSPLVAHAAR